MSVVVLSVLCFCSLFVLHDGFFIRPNNLYRQQQNVIVRAVVVLEAEPDGGTELVPRNSLAGCRMKEVQFVRDATNDSDGPVYSFWMTAQVEGALIKEIRSQILKDASKKANFPGFRKGQVPPYAQPQITQFSVQEAIIKTCQSVVDAYGLKSLPGSEGEVKVHEDVDKMVKGYKIGDTIQFTASINAVYDRSMTQLDEEIAVDSVIDVVATSTVSE